VLAPAASGYPGFRRGSVADAFVCRRGTRRLLVSQSASRLVSYQQAEICLVTSPELRAEETKDEQQQQQQQQQRGGSRPRQADCLSLQRGTDTRSSAADSPPPTGCSAEADLAPPRGSVDARERTPRSPSIAGEGWSCFRRSPAPLSSTRCSLVCSCPTVTSSSFSLLQAKARHSVPRPPPATACPTAIQSPPSDPPSTLLHHLRRHVALQLALARD
jgi:hypothetical protein